MTAAIQNILTAAQSLGSQVHYKRSRMTILGLAGVLFCMRKRADIDKMDYRMFRRKYLLGCSGEARRSLKATVGNRVKPDYHFIA